MIKKVAITQNILQVQSVQQHEIIDILSTLKTIKQ